MPDLWNRFRRLPLEYLTPIGENRVTRYITARYLTFNSFIFDFLCAYSKFSITYQANYLAAEMVAGAAQEAEEAVGIEAMNRKAEQEATQRAAAAASGSGGNGGGEGGSNGNSRAGLGANKGTGGGEGKAQGQKRKFVPASTN